jgi:hypothetical protein
VKGHAQLQELQYKRKGRLGEGEMRSEEDEVSEDLIREALSPEL